MATRTIANAGGTWNVTTTWVEGVVPSSADDVVSTATSGNLTISSAGGCRSMDLRLGTLTINQTSSGFTIGSATLPADGYSLRLGSGITWTGAAGGPTFTNTNATAGMLDLGGRTLVGATFTGNVKLMSALTLATGGVPTITHTNRTFDANGQTITTGVFQSTGSNARTVNLNGATLNVFQGDRGSLVLSGSNLTVNAATSVVNVTSTGIVQIQVPGIVLGDLNFTSSGAPAIGGASQIFTCARLTRNTTVVNDKFMLQAGLTVTVTDKLTLSGLSSSKRMWVAIGQRGSTNQIPEGSLSPFTFDLGAAGTAVLANVDLMDVAFTGTNLPVTGSRIGDCGGNSGVACDTPRPLFWRSGTGAWSDPTHWSLTSGGATGELPPLPQDVANIDVNSGASGSLSLDTHVMCGTLNHTAPVAITINNGSQPACIFGDVIVTTSTGQFTGAGTLTLYGRGNRVIDQRRNDNSTIAKAMEIRAVAGTYTIMNSMRVTGIVTLLSGTLAFGPNGKLQNDGGISGQAGLQPRTLDWGAAGQWTWTANTVWMGTVANGFTMLNADKGLLISAATATSDIRSSGQPMPSLTVNASTFVTSLTDAYTTGGAITVNGGTLDTTGKAVTCGSLTSTGPTTRTLTLGASTVTINGSLTFAGTGLTFTPGTSTIAVEPTGQADVATNGVTFNTMTLKPANDAGLTVRDGGTWATLNVTGTAAGTGHVAINQDITVTGTLNATGTSISTPVLIYGPAFGGRASITGATTTLTNARFTNIVRAGAGSWTGSGVTFVDTNWSSAVSVG